MKQSSRWGVMWPLYSSRSRVLCAVGVILLSAACSGTGAVLGTELSNGAASPSVQMTDQFGNNVAISDYQGKVVVLTFLYTDCPDICPVVVRHLRQAYVALGEQTQDVMFVAISVDPKRDTVDRVHAYLDKHGVLHEWKFLVGEEEELSTVWAAYFVAPYVDNRAVSNESQQYSASSLGVYGMLRDDLEVKYMVSHAAPVYVIDRQGVSRVLFTLPFSSNDLVHDVQLMLN